MSKIKVANASAFWGDWDGAAAELLSQDPSIDFITFDYLAEVSMGILAIQREKDPSKGYAADFVEVVRSLIPFWKQGLSFRLITNAGGLEPEKCAAAVAEALVDFPEKKIGVVSGDDITEKVKSDPNGCVHIDSHVSVHGILDRMVAANAYLGAESIVKVLDEGADIVITGRVADPSLTVAACAHTFSWKAGEYEKLAGASVAGHVIECGTQATGGIFTDWLSVDEIRYPIVEVESSGEFVLRGASVEMVKEQLLYEIGDPYHYDSPDVQLSYENLKCEEGVRVSGAVGLAPSEKIKVGVVYDAGYRSECSLVIYGERAAFKARRAADWVKSRLESMESLPERYHVEVIGAGDIVSGAWKNEETHECVLRIAVSDPSREKLIPFTKMIAPLVTAGPPGTTGYTTGRPKIRREMKFWPCLIGREEVKPRTKVFAVGEGVENLE